MVDNASNATPPAFARGPNPSTRKSRMPPPPPKRIDSQVASQLPVRPADYGYDRWTHYVAELSDSDGEEGKKKKRADEEKQKKLNRTDPAAFVAEEDFDNEYYSEDEAAEDVRDEYRSVAEEEAELVATEMDRVYKNGIEWRHNADKDFILHIRLSEIRPPIWRRVRVPADTTLDDLHDKILIPIFSFSRNYHVRFALLLAAYNF
jgi:hypothetical protein